MWIPALSAVEHGRRTVTRPLGAGAHADNRRRPVRCGASVHPRVCAPEGVPRWRVGCAANPPGTGQLRASTSGALASACAQPLPRASARSRWKRSAARSSPAEPCNVRPAASGPPRAARSRWQGVWLAERRGEGPPSDRRHSGRWLLRDQRRPPPCVGGEGARSVDDRRHRRERRESPPSTSFQVGGSVGLAVLATIAAGGGFRVAFASGNVIALAGAAVALRLTWPVHELGASGTAPAGRRGAVGP